MPKKGRRTERDEALGADPGGLGGDEDYDWIKYLGDGRASASPSSAFPAGSAPATAIRTQPRTSAPPPARTAAPSRPYERDADLVSGGETDPRRGATVDRGGAGRGLGRGQSARRSDQAIPRDGGFADRGGALGMPDLAGPDSDPYAGPPKPDQPRRFGRRARADRPGPGTRTEPDDWPARADRTDPGDGTGPMRSVGREGRSQPGGAPDQRGGNGPGQPSRDAAERRTPGTRPGRAVKVRPGSATDLLYNPSAGDYGQPLYAPPGDHGQPRPGRQPDDRFTSPQRRLDTAEYAKPLYPSIESGPATDARPRRAWPDDDPVADTDARGRSAGPPARRRRGDPPTGSGIGVLWPSEPASAPPARSVSAGSETAIANAPVRRASTGPLDRLALDSQEPLAEPLDRPGPAPAPPGKPTRKTPKGVQKAGTTKPRTSRSAPKPGTSRPRTARRRKVAALLVCGLVIVAAGAAYGYFKLMPRTSHTVTAPAALGAFSRQPANATAEDLKHRILTTAAGDVKNVVAAVYEQKKGPGTSKGPQIVVFIGGNLTGNASADDLINAYVTRLHSAFTTSPGSLGGQAACAPGSNGSPSECAWADGDTFGVLVSATLSATGLADEMRQMRPLVEHVIK